MLLPNLSFYLLSRLLSCLIDWWVRFVSFRIVLWFFFSFWATVLSSLTAISQVQSFKALFNHHKVYSLILFWAFI